MQVPTLREYCKVVASTITGHLLGIEWPENDAKLNKLISSLEQEMRSEYEKQGSPQGESEADLVYWLLQNTTYEIGDEF